MCFALHPIHTLLQSNAYQAIIITDGENTYSVFTYKCGEMEWARGATIGYNSGGEQFRNHPLSGEIGTPTIACSNLPRNEFVNVVYKLSIENPTGVPEPATVEPRKYIRESYCTPSGSLNFLGKVLGGGNWNSSGCKGTVQHVG